MRNSVFTGIDQLPTGCASNKITEGCIVLEGGAFRGVYTSGVLDALMQADINLSCTVGVSAGALNGVNYVSGQIGRAGRVNLMYRHDSRYVGVHALMKNKGIIGFDFVFHKMDGIVDFDEQRFNSPDKRFIAAVTNCITGKTEYLEKGKCSDIFQAVRASASMPYVSKMVYVDSTPYLDGGCSSKVPYQWALDNKYDKIVVVRTRPLSYRRKVKQHHGENKIYRKYPEFAKALADTNAKYNYQCEDMNRLEKQGRIFVISPSQPVTVGRLERDMEKLGALYYLGYTDTQNRLDELKEYLNK
jgi:predicted patatin/cPLA2 family phospholipase